MKKSLLACLLVLGVCFGLYADSAEDTQFRQYVEANKNAKTNPEGMTICADNTYRIIYTAMPFSANYSDVTPQIQQAMKKAIVEALRKQKADCQIIKKLKITLVYTPITTDKRAFTIVISHKDL